VFCGTAAGAVSARKGAYYAGPGNKFWPMLFKTGLTPRLLRPEEFSLLPEWGIGLTDIVKTRSGGDRVFSRADYDAASLERVIRECTPALLVFNGKNAAKRYLGRRVVPYGSIEDASIGDSRLFVAPSTSGAANGFWDESYWFEAAALVRAVTSNSRDSIRS
jgi:TDG/mug DNA glycosylase family protein